MNKEQFLKQLQRKVKQLPKEDKEEIIRDYVEYFHNAKLEGKDENETIASLGSPDQLSKELLATYSKEKGQNIKPATTIFRSVWAAIGLGFLNLIFVLAPFLAVVAVVISLWISAVAFILAPVVVLINAVVSGDSFFWFDFFAAIGFTGIGIFFFIGNYFLTKILMSWTMRYLHYNIAVVKGGK